VSKIRITILRRDGDAIYDAVHAQYLGQGRVFNTLENARKDGDELSRNPMDDIFNFEVQADELLELADLFRAQGFPFQVSIDRELVYAYRANLFGEWSRK